jgi:hypothetical protein
MKGFIKQTAATLCFSASLLTVLGCYHYRDIVDPCWPERYNSIAAHSVREIHNAQSDKGHLLDQTIWSDDFDGAKLKPSAIARLERIAHLEPVPLLLKVYLQDAKLPYDAKKAPEEQIDAREILNQARARAIQAYLATQRSELRPTAYEVLVHDYVQPTYRSAWTQRALENFEKNLKSGTPQPFTVPSGGSGTGK